MSKSNPQKPTQKQPEPRVQRDRQSSDGHQDHSRGQNRGQRQNDDEDRVNDAPDVRRDGKGRFTSHDE